MPSSLINFPVNGNILINKVTKDRFSLVYNTVGNNYFPIGQYIFFTKNNSVWYKYKTSNNDWSNETLYLPNALSSNTKFDKNGYPVTGYLLSDNSINIKYYNFYGTAVNTSINAYGILPTIAINKIDTFLFYVPLNNLNQLSYVQQFNDFNIVNNYPASVPNNLNSMQIETMNDNSFLFSFECDNGLSSNIYIAFSDFIDINPNVDLLATVNFISHTASPIFDLPASVNFVSNNINQFNFPATVDFISNIVSPTFDLPAIINFIIPTFDLPASVNFIINKFELPASVNFISNLFELNASVDFNSLMLKHENLTEPLLAKTINLFNLPASINFINNGFNLPASVNFINNFFNLSASVDFINNLFNFPASVNFINNNFIGTNFNLPASINFINTSPNNTNNNFNLPATINFINSSNVGNHFDLNCFVQFGKKIIYNSFPLPPNIKNLNLVNTGTKAFAGINKYNNYYYILYNSIHHPDDNIGNYSIDGINWTPNLNNTDPPSHFIITNKNFNTNCNFYPVFNTHDNIFAIAWIENNPLGRLSLKYNDISMNNLPIVLIPINNPNHNLNPINNQTIYVYPDLINAETFVKTQNIPMSDIQIVDNSNNIFNLDVFEADVNGCELTMPDTIKSLRFSQYFREKIILKGFVGTAKQQGNLNSIPLSNIPIIIYYGKTNQICDLISTDINGKFSINLNPGKYVFEIGVNTSSITYSQLIV